MHLQLLPRHSIDYLMVGDSVVAGSKVGDLSEMAFQQAGWYKVGYQYPLSYRNIANEEHNFNRICSKLEPAVRKDDIHLRPCETTKDVCNRG